MGFWVQRRPKLRESLAHLGISEANLRHGRQTKEKLAAQRHSANVGRRVLAQLKRIEAQLIDAGLMPDE